MNQSPIHKVDIRILLDLISNFYKLDLSKSTLEDIWSQQSKILERFAVQQCFHEELLFRAYKTDEPIEDESWLWIPPNQKPSRISMKDKNVLYTSSSVPGAIIEANIKENEEFNLISYRLKADQKLHGNMILNLDTPIKDNFNNQDYIILRILQNFVESEFLRHVVDANSFQYKTTQSLVWNLFDKYHGEVDAFFYPSVAHYRRAYNVAVKESKFTTNQNGGINKLEVQSVQRAIRLPVSKPFLRTNVFMESTEIKNGNIHYERISPKPI
ncbi:MAG: RES domain-containing protein [Bacteroidota bacterium]